MALFEGNWSLNARRSLTNDDVQQILAHAKRRSHRDYLLLALTYNLATLVSEIIHVKVSDVLQKHSALLIIPLRKATQIRPIPKALEYPIMPEVLSLIVRWIKSQHLGSNDWLFKGRASACTLLKYPCDGGHLTRRQAQRLFDLAATGAGVKISRRGIHSLRHARLTQIAAQSRDPWLVRDAGRLRSVAHGDAYVQFVRMKDYIRQVGGKL